MNRSKIVVIIVLLVLGVFFIVTTCYRFGEKKAQKALPAGMHGVVIEEAIQTSNYTYLRVKENNTMFWIAVVKTDSKAGDSVYYRNAFEMKNFVSKELGRTFPTVYFIQDPTSKMPVAQAAPKLTPQKVEVVKKAGISVQVPKEGITLASLYKNPGDYKGKNVIIRGVVVKFNSQIMNKNWIHIQDGTESAGKFDLTITTKDSVAVGSTATFKGIIALDKDFGYGYSYDVIMEQATAGDIAK
ncbi:MAG: hypothetical protein WCK34_02205 [Bacteroidota bacterium]